MLRIWTGRAKSGKTQKIAECIKILGNGSRQILLVPQYATHEAEIELCRECGATVSRHAEVLSFESLSERVLNIVGGSAAVELDGGGKLLTMQKTMEELAGELHFFRRSFMNSAFLKNLVSLADEFESYRVDAEQLYTLSEQMEGGSRDKLRDLALIFAAYEGKLTESGVDRRSRVRCMVEKLSESGYVKDKDIFIDGISYFNACEEQAIAVMLRESRSLTVSMLADDRDESDIFEDTLATVAALKQLATVSGVPFEVEKFVSSGEDTPLSYIEAHFFGDAAPYAGDYCGAVHLTAAMGSYAEVETAAAEIRRLVAQEGYRYRDIGIMVKDLASYRALLAPILRRYEIPFYMSEQRELCSSALCTLVSSLLESVTGSYAYEDMFRWLKTGLTPFTGEECDALENYCIRWRVRGSSWTREEPWTMHPDGYGAAWTEESYRELDALNALRLRVRAIVLPLAEGLRDATVREMLAVLYEVLVTLGVPEKVEQHAEQMQKRGEIQAAEEYSQLWNMLIHVLDECAEIMGDSRMSAEEFSRLLRLVLSEYHVGSIPVALDQVKISPLTQNDRQTVRALFILGANEGVIPSFDGRKGLLTEEEREEMGAEGLRLAPGEKQRFTLELQNLYAALAQPREKLYVSYPKADAGGAELRPAFIVARLQTLFPGLAVENASLARLCTAPKSALPLAGEKGGKALRAYFDAAGIYDDALRAMDRAAQVKRGKLSPGAVELLYGRRFRMSASRMDKLRQCHYAYFLQYGLKAKKRSESVFDSMEAGTFLHYILENVGRETMRLGGFAAVEDEKLRELTRQYAERFAKEQLFGDRQQSARFRYLFRRTVKSAQEIILDLAGELRCSDFKPLAFELSFGNTNEDELPAITVQEGENTLQLNGKVDRVDGWIHEGKLYLRVMDYKTGKKKFDLADVRYGLNLQMLLYLFALEEQGESLFDKPIVPAGVLYMPAREELLSMDRASSDEQIRNSMASKLRRSGLMLDDKAVLAAMEHPDEKGKTKYIPLSSHALGSIASAEQIGILSRHVTQQMRDITREMAAGIIDADPCCHNEQNTACAFCEFETVCHFENGVGGDRLRYIRPAGNLDDYWEGLRRATEEGGGEV